MPPPKPTLAISLTQHLRQVRLHLAPLDLDALARRSGFLRRTPRKIPMLDLVLALLALAVECCLSLERVAAVIGLAAGTSYSKQALHKRLTDRIERFVAQVAVALFGQLSHASDLQGWLQPFPRVLLHDSATQALPEHLASVFPGSSNQKAIQPIYRLRWRIEMIFKAWKSYLGLRELNCRTADLLRLSLMTKLLFCVLVRQVCNQLELLPTDGRHVSLLRLARIIAECSCLARRASDQTPIFDIMNRPFVFPPFSPAPRSVESLKPGGRGAPET